MTSFDEAFEKEAQRIEDSDEIYNLREALRQANTKLKKTKVSAESVAEAAFEGAKAAMLSLGRPKPGKLYVPSKTGKGKAEVAMWCLSDWQGAKITPTYNSEVMRKRVHEYVDTALKITDIQRADHPVNECTITLGGDMIEGLFNYPTQLNEIDMTLFDQFVSVASLLAEVVRRAAAAYTKVHVIGEPGNHGRIGSKRDGVPRYDNADRMTYRLAAEMTSNLPNVTWQDSREDIQLIEIGNYRALLLHGDEVGRNGFSSPMGIVNYANRQASGAFRIEGEVWRFQDMYIHHYHQHQEWTLANGEGAVYMTGSTESDNRYARDMMAAAAIPSQRLHFIDPRKARVTAQYKITLT